MHIIRYHTSESPAPLVGVRDEGQVFGLPGVGSLADLWALPLAEIRQRVAERVRVPAADVTLLPPVDGRTEVWAAGVTYYSSREARVEESERSADIYRQVYDAERPELFFKSAAWRVAGDGQTIRRDGAIAWQGRASTSALRRRFDDLAGYLMRADIHPGGVVLSTGTCLVPPAPFSLADGDVVAVAVDQVGVLTTGVVRGLDRMREDFERQAPPLSRDLP